MTLTAWKVEEVGKKTEEAGLGKSVHSYKQLLLVVGATVLYLLVGTFDWWSIINLLVSKCNLTPSHSLFILLACIVTNQFLNSILRYTLSQLRRVSECLFQM